MARCTGEFENLIERTRSSREGIEGRSRVMSEVRLDIDHDATTMGVSVMAKGTVVREGEFRVEDIEGEPGFNNGVI